MVCKKRCTYRLHPTLEGAIKLENNVEIRHDFDENESRLFKFRVPSKSELGGVNEGRIKSVTILARPMIETIDFK